MNVLQENKRIKEKRYSNEIFDMKYMFVIYKFYKNNYRKY
jgi:hypothetical protein